MAILAFEVISCKVYNVYTITPFLEHCESLVPE